MWIKCEQWILFHTSSVSWSSPGPPFQKVLPLFARLNGHRNFLKFLSWIPTKNKHYCPIVNRCLFILVFIKIPSSSSCVWVKYTADTQAHTREMARLVQCFVFMHLSQPKTQTVTSHLYNAFSSLPSTENLAQWRKLHINIPASH